MKRLLCFAIAALIAGCSLLPASTELEQNRALWEAQSAENYDFQLSIWCFCPFGGQMPLAIEVRDGEPVSIAAADGSDVTPNRESYSQVDTIEELFGVVEEAQSGGADEIKVEYDPEYGYPVSIDIDYIQEAVDDEVSYQVANLEFLP